MKSRTTRKTILFMEPFSLRGCGQTLEPGVYLVETDEELLEGLSFVAYQRTKTFIHLHSSLGRPGTSRTLSVSGDDLDTAINIGRAARERDERAQHVGAANAAADLSALDRADDDGMNHSGWDASRSLN